MILLDNCMPHRYVNLLSDWGYMATRLGDHVATDSTDAIVIKKAGELDAVLLTVDLDFSNILDYPPKDHRGIC